MSRSAAPDANPAVRGAGADHVSADRVMAPRVPRISVVVATYKRAETLNETLRHLQEQTLAAQDFEVIVVDDGSPDNTAEIAQQWQQKARFAVQYLHHANHGPGYTQNRGIRLARAPIVLLIADDIFLAPGALAAHLARHEAAAAGEVAVLGRVLQSPRLAGSVFLTKWDPWHLGDLPDGLQMPYYMFWACNISFRRDFMLQQGMFKDEMGRAGAAAHEDVELGYRLYQHGLRVVFDRNALGFHHHVETLKGSLQRSYQRGLNWLDFRQRVPNPELDVAYRAYDIATLISYRDELSGPRQPFLMGADKSLVWLALRYLQRSIMFNRITTRFLWLPLFDAAERIRWLGSCVHENMYRGVIVHYFVMGCRDGRERFGERPSVGG